MNSHTRSHLDVAGESRDAPPVVDAAPILATPGDAEFIAAAYSLLFHRAPDPVGMVDYRFFLRAGYARLEILKSLAQSEEARAKAGRIVNLPASKPVGFWKRLVRFARVRIRWLVWYCAERPNEIAEQLIGVAAPERYWDLAYKTTASELHRHWRFESLLHLWRRDMARDLGRIEAELQRLARELGPARDFAAAGLSAGEVHFKGLRISLPAAEVEELASQAVGRHVSGGVIGLLERVLRPGMTVFDSDAGCGVFTLMAAKLVSPGGRVWATASDMPGYSLLVRNLDANGVLQDRDVVVQSGSAGGAPPLRALLAAEGSRLDLVRLSGAAAAVNGMADSILQLASLNPGLKVLYDCHADRPSGETPEARCLLDTLRESGFRCSRICPSTGTLLPVVQMPAGGLSLWLERDQHLKEKFA